MSPEEHTDAIHALQTHVTEIKALVNNGLKTLVFDQKTEVAVVKENVQRMREALTSHLAKEDVILEIFRRVMSIGVTITGALVAILLSIIGYLLVNPRGFTH